MGFARTYRLVEGSIVVLFFLEAARAAFAALLSLVNVALQTGQVTFGLIEGHAVLLLVVVLPWLAPRGRTALPELLSLSAIGVGTARLMMGLPVPGLQLYAALVVLGLGAVYFASLLRANWQRWIIAWIIGLTLDQLMRAGNSYDITLRSWVTVPALGVELAIPWLAVQAVLTVLLIAVSRLARGTAHQEPYRPARLSIGGGVAFGAFLALELLALAMPNVGARWSGVSFGMLVPWLLLATTLPLAVSMRQIMGETLSMFGEGLRGWIWLTLLLMLTVVSNRLDGPGAAGALVVAQYMTVLLLWWMPSPARTDQPTSAGLPIAVGMLVCIVLIYVYSLTFEYMYGLSGLQGQGLIVLLLAMLLVNVPRLLPRSSDDPWLALPAVPRGVAATFIAPVFVFGMLLGALRDIPPQTPGDTLRVATYNINGGYDAEGQFQLDLIAQTIEAATPDVVMLQEVDTGQPVGYGIDQVTYLAERLDMYAAYYPTVEQLYGLAILSRWPLVETSGLLLPGDGEQLGALSGQLVLNSETGQQVTFVDTQLLPASDNERIEQMAVLLGLLNQDRPAVLGGDLGAPPEDELYQQLQLIGMNDPDVEMGIEGGYTYPSTAPAFRRDYVLTRGLTPLDSRQVQSTASDHRLVVVEMLWPGG